MPMIDQNKLEAAAEAIDSETSICAEAGELACTRDTIAEFIAANGRPALISTAANGLRVYEWGVGRKTLAVVDCGNARAALCM
jgi:hypothetical protein